jgi:hypothetical protein
MKAIYRLALALTLAVVALPSPSAHAQGVTANIQGTWQAGSYLVTVWENGFNNDGSLDYVASIANLDGSAIMHEGYRVDIPIRGTLRGNPIVGYWFDFVFEVQLDHFTAANGSGQLTLNREQNVLDGTWTVTGEAPQRLTLYRR